MKKEEEEEDDQRSISYKDTKLCNALPIQT